MRNLDDQWCVLRVAGRSTLALAASLGRAGYEVWTPTETRTVRVPRANVRRTVTLPLMPSYVFAKATRLLDLFQLADEPLPHARFSVWHDQNRIPLIADRHLANLRRLEAKRTPRKKAERSFAPGAEVKVGAGAFGGMIGRVERSDTGQTLVCFSDKFVVKLATSLLNIADLEESSLRRAA